MEYTYTDGKTKKLVDIPCQNCGTPVSIMVPFVGCVFCADCVRGETISDASASEFYKKA